MGFRFSNRVSILPGLKLNLSKSGVSLSAGVRGAHINLGPRGLYGTAGLPGTGLSYRQRLDGPARSYDRPSVERQLSARQLEAQLRREEKEAQAQAAQDAIEAEWQQYQGMLFFWKPLPQIPSLDDFAKAQVKRPFETTLEVPPQPDWDQEQSNCVERLSTSLRSELPYKLLPQFVAKRKAMELMPTLWPAEQAQIQSRHDESLTEYQERLKAEETKWDADENERIAWLQRLTTGDNEEVHHTVNEIFAGLCLPIKSHTECSVLFDASDLISVNLELPEMDENIPFTRKKLLKSGEVREVARDQTERNRDYFDLVTGESAFFAAEIFSYLPLCHTIRVAGHTPRPKVKEDDPADVYVLEANYAREGLKAYDADQTSMLSFLTHSGARFDLAPDFKLQRIDPPSWLAHADAQENP